MNKMTLQPVYIVGPTASGKSDLALLLAKKVGGVIISADSMQIYRGLDVGTAKATVEERREVEHKMIDIVNAEDEFSVAQYAELANIEIKNALNSGKLPIIVGGTGLYFEALIYPMSFSNVTKDPKLRDKLQREFEEFGADHMHKKLESFDKAAADRLHVNDVKRVIRALEIVLTTNQPLKSDFRPVIREDDVIMIGLNCERQKLYERINARVEKMFEDGLAREALNACDFESQSMQAIGYKEFKDCPCRVENGVRAATINLDEIKEKIKQHTRNYAKRQLTWFKKYDFVKWFDVGEKQAAIDYIMMRLSENK